MAVLPPPPLPVWGTGTGNSPPARKLPWEPLLTTRLGSASTRSRLLRRRADTKYSNEVWWIWPDPNSDTAGLIAIWASPEARPPIGLPPGPLFHPKRLRPSVRNELKPRLVLAEREISAKRIWSMICWPPEISRKFKTFWP